MTCDRGGVTPTGLTKKQVSFVRLSRLEKYYPVIGENNHELPHERRDIRDRGVRDGLDRRRHG